MHATYCVVCAAVPTLAGEACVAEPVPKAAKALNVLSKGLSPSVEVLLRSNLACIHI